MGKLRSGWIHDRYSGRSSRVWHALFLVILVGLSSIPAFASNIITFDDNANSCGGAVLCSTNGTIGYLNNGTGQPFDLSTISQWFQIDVTSTNLLPGSQTMAEPDGGSGGYLVVNNTGSTVTSFSITISNNFTTSTGCTISGSTCNNFQGNKGAAAPGGATETLSGPGLFACTNSNSSGPGFCTANGGQVAANFSGPGTVTYTWSGLNIGAGDTFDISFASWTGASTSSVGAPEPSSLLLLGLGLAGVIGLGLRTRLG